MIDLKKMSENTKLEVALEILSSKIANMSKQGYTIENKEMKNLLEERTQMYKENQKIIEKIIREYGPEIKKIYDEA